MLDGLSDHDADTVALLITFDFLKGATRIAGRIVEWLNGDTCGREDSAGAVQRKVAAVTA